MFGPKDDFRTREQAVADIDRLIRDMKNAKVKVIMIQWPDIPKLGYTHAERKQARKEHFEKFVKGWKLRPCLACNGSGRYDHNGSPKCGACDGTGKERYKPRGSDVQDN